MSFEKLIRIPNDRVGALIGKSGSVKSKIETECHVTLDVDGDSGEVFIKTQGDVEKIQPFKAMEIVTAIGRGFFKTHFIISSNILSKSPTRIPLLLKNLPMLLISRLRNS